jgi:hypothetical protein
VNDEKYIGLDVHQATVVVAVMDSTGKLVMESNARPGGRGPRSNPTSYRRSSPSQQRQSAPELAPRVALPIVPRRGCLSLAKFKTCNGVNRFFRAAQVFSADHALEIPRRCECEILRDGDSAGVCGEQIP